MREKELILYAQLEQETLLKDMVWLMERYDDNYYNDEDKKALLYECIRELLAMAAKNGFYGNLWHCYLTNLMVNHENAYSTGCEIVGQMEGSMNAMALHDFTILKDFFDYDFSKIKTKLSIDCLDELFDFAGSLTKSKVYNERIRETICKLAVKLARTEHILEMKECMADFYQNYGVGKFGLHKAFRVENKGDNVEIKPILNIDHVYLEDLIGYEIPKQKLIDNTEAFVSGKRANNCLLFGDAGTGKSSSIKGILNEYYDRGLRIIELYKHQFQDLNDVIGQIKNRNYKFIIYMDDLSFEEFEIEYKYLKAVIEGGLENKPKNVLIYATSNRRHLVREKFSDKEERREDLHSSDTVQEKLSLVARFGVSIFFCAPDRREFQNIVKTLAQRHKITLPEEDLLLEANKWELSHGGLSGRTAQQFIDYLLGKK